MRRTPRRTRAYGPLTRRVPIGGGASNRKGGRPAARHRHGALVGLPQRPALEGAYEISNQKLRSGGSEYVFTLSAAQATPGRAYLKVVFEQAIR